MFDMLLAVGLMLALGLMYLKTKVINILYLMVLHVLIHSINTG